MSNRKNMAVFLKEKRKAAKLSQAQVADRLGYKSAQFISNWERGISSPPVETLRVLANMYLVPEEEMLQKIIDATIEDVRADLEKRFKLIREPAAEAVAGSVFELERSVSIG